MGKITWLIDSEWHKPSARELLKITCVRCWTAIKFISSSLTFHLRLWLLKPIQNMSHIYVFFYVCIHCLRVSSYNQTIAAIITAFKITFSFLPSFPPSVTFFMWKANNTNRHQQQQQLKGISFNLCFEYEWSCNVFIFVWCGKKWGKNQVSIRRRRRRKRKNWVVSSPCS